MLSGLYLNMFRIFRCIGIWFGCMQLIEIDVKFAKRLEMRLIFCNTIPYLFFGFGHQPCLSKLRVCVSLQIPITRSDFRWTSPSFPDKKTWKFQNRNDFLADRNDDDFLDAWGVLDARFSCRACQIFLIKKHENFKVETISLRIATMMTFYTFGTFSTQNFHVIRVGFFTAVLALVQIRRESFLSGAASERKSSDRYDYFKKAK